MTPEDKEYYSDGYQPLFNLMLYHDLTLTEGEMYDIINCVRKMDEAQKVKPLRENHEEYRGTNFNYKGIDCMVTQVPHSIIDYFEIRPMRLIDNIGSGCGGSVRLTEKQFFKNKK